MTLTSTSVDLIVGKSGFSGTNSKSFKPVCLYRRTTTVSPIAARTYFPGAGCVFSTKTRMSPGVNSGPIELSMTRNANECGLSTSLIMNSSITLSGEAAESHETRGILCCLRSTGSNPALEPSLSSCPAGSPNSPSNLLASFSPKDFRPERTSHI